MPTDEDTTDYTLAPPPDLTVETAWQRAQRLAAARDAARAATAAAEARASAAEAAAVAAKAEIEPIRQSFTKLQRSHVALKEGITDGNVLKVAEFLHSQHVAEAGDKAEAWDAWLPKAKAADPVLATLVKSSASPGPSAPAAPTAPPAAPPVSPPPAPAAPPNLTPPASTAPAATRITDEDLARAAAANNGIVPDHLMKRVFEQNAQKV